MRLAVLPNLSANLDDARLSLLFFVLCTLKAGRATFGLCMRHAGFLTVYLSFPVSSSVFGEPNLAIVVITECIATFFVLSILGKFLRRLPETPTSRKVIYFLLLPQMSQTAQLPRGKQLLVPPLVKVQKNHNAPLSQNKYFDTALRLC